MKNKSILFLFLGLVLAVVLSACSTKPNTSSESVSEAEGKKIVTFTAKIPHYNEKTSTPLIVKVKEENKETYTIPTVKPAEKAEKDTYLVEVPVATEEAEVTIVVSPINDDGSLYEIPKKPVETKKENAEVELKLVPKDKVTEKQINDTLTKTKEAMEKGCDELTVEEKNKLLEKQVENSNKADVKKGNETKIS